MSSLNAARQLFSERLFGEKAAVGILMKK